MAAVPKTKLLETCRVGPPPASLPNTSLPLTFFDVIWLQMPPVQRLFFYQFPHNNITTGHFIKILLPYLKHTLSLSLRSFFPLASNLTISPSTGNHEITYIDGDSVSFSLCQSDADFLHLAENHPRETAQLRALVPQLPKSDPQKQPLLALQVTLFPDSGVCIGTTTHHVVADGSSSMCFMKTWASICRLGEDQSAIIPLPIHDRSLLAHLDELKRLLQHQLASVSVADTPAGKQPRDTVLATFEMSRANIERLRRRVLWGRQEDGQRPFHCSAFVLTGAYVCCCLSKSWQDDVGEKGVHFGFPVECRLRLDPPIPAAYFGNCISFCISHMKGNELKKGENGVGRASEVIGRAIEALGGGRVLEGAANWVPLIISLIAAGDRFVSVAGSPKFRVYETDFGWGKPRKVEIISIAETGAISLAESRDEEGGIEIGIVLPMDEMETFTSVFEEGLKDLSHCT